MTDLQIMVTLLEGEYPYEQRNTVGKLILLLKKEFNVEFREPDIMNMYPPQEDYEHENRSIEYGYNYN